MDEQYTLEEVRSLIDWFKGRDLPKELQLNEAIYIPDLPLSIENISTQALTHWENPVFNGNMRLLQEIKEKLESLE